MIAQIDPEPLSDVIPLTSAERARLVELESVVQTYLEGFLSVGRALCEIRNKRLYRQHFVSFEDYCLRRWGFGGSRGLDLVRSTAVAEHLLSGPAAPKTGDAPLPNDLSPDVLRPLTKLAPPLQSACWRLASKITDHPTHHVVSKIVRTVQNAINQGTSSNGNGSAKTTPPTSEKKVFLASVHRLAHGQWFSPQLIVQGLDEAKARTHLKAAELLLCRLQEIIGELRQQFPQL
jgi:hypothetical protein